MLCFMVNELGRDDSIKLEVLLIPHSGPLNSIIRIFGLGSSRFGQCWSHAPHWTKAPHKIGRNQTTLTSSWVLLIWTLQGPKERFSIFDSNMPSRKVYCSRCQKSFPSFSAKQQHIRDSLNHNVCHACSFPPDYATEDDLDNHLEDEHNICTYCDRQFDTPSQLAQHDVAKHNMCMNCRQYFNTPANLSSVCLFISHLGVKNFW